MNTPKSGMWGWIAFTVAFCSGAYVGYQKQTEVWIAQVFRSQYSFQEVVICRNKHHFNIARASSCTPLCCTAFDFQRDAVYEERRKAPGIAYENYKKAHQEMSVTREKELLVPEKISEKISNTATIKEKFTEDSATVKEDKS